MRTADPREKDFRERFINDNSIDAQKFINDIIDKVSSEEIYKKEMSTWHWPDGIVCVMPTGLDHYVRFIAEELAEISFFFDGPIEDILGRFSGEAAKCKDPVTYYDIWWHAFKTMARFYYTDDEIYREGMRHVSRHGIFKADYRY